SGVTAWRAALSPEGWRPLEPPLDTRARKALRRRGSATRADRRSFTERSHAFTSASTSGVRGTTSAVQPDSSHAWRSLLACSSLLIGPVQPERGGSLGP